jgi:hypothetical protein
MVSHTELSHTELTEYVICRGGLQRVRQDESGTSPDEVYRICLLDTSLSLRIESFFGGIGGKSAVVDVS